jgi:hypothetical protein
VGLERGPINLVRIIEELLEWKSSGSGQENRINGRGDPLRWPRDTLYEQKLALTSPANGGHLVGIVRLRTKSHGVCLFLCLPTVVYLSSAVVIIMKNACLEEVLKTCILSWNDKPSNVNKFK